ncbi:MAG: hypothetical protein OHK0038_28150 [Flammeovirgaceae bacterium]
MRKLWKLALAFALLGTMAFGCHEDARNSEPTPEFVCQPDYILNKENVQTRAKITKLDNSRYYFAPFEGSVEYFGGDICAMPDGFIYDGKASYYLFTGKVNYWVIDPKIYKDSPFLYIAGIEILTTESLTPVYEK